MLGATFCVVNIDQHYHRAINLIFNGFEVGGSICYTNDHLGLEPLFFNDQVSITSRTTALS